MPERIDTPYMQTNQQHKDRAGDSHDPRRQGDFGHFDGSADPNPGGRLGWGWHLHIDGLDHAPGAGEAPPAPGNTNNRGEYRGLLALLTDYIARGGGGPLTVYGDSQLIIYQVTGKWQCKDAALAQLCRQARQLASQVRGGVEYRWVPRAQNGLADRAAGGRMQEQPWGGAGPVYAECVANQHEAQGPAVSALLARSIASLNAWASPGFKAFAGLKVGGQDDCSRLKLALLQEMAGTTCTSMISQAFKEDTTAQAVALRWAARGLAVQHAIRKVEVDRELAQRAQRSRGRRD